MGDTRIDQKRSKSKKIVPILDSYLSLEAILAVSGDIDGDHYCINISKRQFMWDKKLSVGGS